MFYSLESLQMSENTTKFNATSLEIINPQNISGYAPEYNIRFFHMMKLIRSQLNLHIIIVKLGPNTRKDTVRVRFNNNI